MKNAIYETRLTDAQWACLKPMLSKPAKRRRPPIDRRRILDAVLYLVKCGCPWRYLPLDFPAWKTVYHVFRQWTCNHQWAALNDALRTLVRKTHGKRYQPTAAILDSQSVKSAGHGGGAGHDAGKRIKGRKRQLLVDTLGLVPGVAVIPASTTERDGAQMVLGRVLGWFTWLRILWVDGGYTGERFAQWVKRFHPKLAVEVVKRSHDTLVSPCCHAVG
ncbi:MAG TPA: IS5 family transposase [Verrucomicrobiae bacterium]|nr:IS5 family transposase [Verrucomicrobiae bacterium]